MLFGSFIENPSSSLHYGVKAKAVALDESRMKAELDEGHPIVVNVGPGDFISIDASSVKSIVCSFTCSAG